MKNKKSYFSPVTFFLLALIFFVGIVWAGPVSVDNTGETETVITLEIELCPDPADDPNTPEKEGPTTEDLEEFAEKHEAEAERIWNARKTKFRVKRGEKRKTVRFDIKFTILDNCEADQNPDKKRYKVHLGKPSAREKKNADARNLWLTNTSKTVAHEFGHTMGLNDEYYSYYGPTRNNLMGRGSNKTVLNYHIMTILFLHYDNPNKDELQKRRNMKTLLRMKDQSEARRLGADMGIDKDQYDAYKDQFDVNGTEIQPERPQLQQKK